MQHLRVTQSAAEAEASLADCSATGLGTRTSPEMSGSVFRSTRRPIGRRVVSGPDPQLDRPSHVAHSGCSSPGGVSAMTVNPLGALRAAQTRTIAAVWLVVGAIAVGIAVPQRWDGAYGARGSFIPLRPPTVPEAAALIKCEWAQVVGLTPQFVYISTRIYLHPRTPLLLPTGVLRCPDSREEVRFADKGGTEVNYRLIHRVDRAAVEQLLGRPLTATNVSVACGTTSYVSYRWWLFAAGDALFIAFFYTVLTLILRRIRRPSSWFALPAIIVAFDVAWWFGRLVYSPASVFGGSEYYRRVLIEEGPWPRSLGLLGDPGNDIVAMAVGGLAILGLVRIRERIPVVGRVRPFHYWTLIATAIGGPILLLISAAHRSFEIDRLNAGQTIDAVVSQIGRAHV